MVDDTVQVNRMIFVGTLVGMVLVAVILMAALANMKANHREDAVTRRTKQDACRAVENELLRTICINGWGN